MTTEHPHGCFAELQKEGGKGPHCQRSSTPYVPTLAKSIHAVFSAVAAWAEVDGDPTRAFVVVRLEQAHLFGYPGFIAMRLPRLDDGVFFQHAGRLRELKRRLLRALSG